MTEHANWPPQNPNGSYRVVTESGTLLAAYDTAARAGYRQDRANDAARLLGIATRYHVEFKP